MRQHDGFNWVKAQYNPFSSKKGIENRSKIPVMQLLKEAQFQKAEWLAEEHIG
jgi:hypothetical protein